MKTKKNRVCINMIKVINLATNEEMIFGESMTIELAVCSAYCMTNNLKTWWLAMIENEMLATNAMSSLPIVRGEKTFACGDWCATLS